MMGIDESASVVVDCGMVSFHGGAEGTEERVLTLREYEAREWIDESASVVVDCGMVSLMVEQKAPRSVS